MSEVRLLPFTETIFCEMVAYREDPDGYVHYVFKDLVEFCYVMVTKLPNWDLPFIEIGDTGYMKYMEAVAGQDTWWDAKNEVNVPYKSDGSYMLNWIFSTGKQTNKSQ